MNYEFTIDMVLRFLPADSHIFICLNKQWRCRYLFLFKTYTTKVKEITNTERCIYAAQYGFVTTNYSVQFARYGYQHIFAYAFAANELRAESLQGEIAYATKNNHGQLVSFLLKEGTLPDWRALCSAKTILILNELCRFSDSQQISTAAARYVYARCFVRAKRLLRHPRLRIEMATTCAFHAVTRRNYSTVQVWLERLEKDVSDEQLMFYEMGRVMDHASSVGVVPIVRLVLSSMEKGLYSKRQWIRYSTKDQLNRARSIAEDNGHEIVVVLITDVLINNTVVQ